MKKFIVLMLVVVMVCSAPFTVLGEGEKGELINSVYDKEEIEKQARALFDLSSVFQMENSDFREDKRTGKTDWYLYFYNQSDGSYFYCTFDAKTAELRSFDRLYKNNTGLLMITEEEAESAAKACIEKYNPGLTDSLIESELSDVSFLKQGYTSKYSYYFTYVQVVEDVVFPSNFITVQVSGFDKEVVSYQKAWSQWKYERKGSFLSDAAVLSKFRAKDIVKPEYVRKTDTDSKSIILTSVYRLEYPENESGYLTAIEGDFLLSTDLYQDGSIVEMPIYEEDASKSESAGGVSYSTAPEKGVISAEDAATYIKEKLSFLPEVTDMAVLSSEYTAWYNGVEGKYWRIYLYAETESYLSVVIDSEHPKILYASYNKSQEPVIPYDVKRNSEQVVSVVTSSMEKANLEDVALTLGTREGSGGAVRKEELVGFIKAAFPEIDSSQVNLDRYESDPDYNRETYWGYRTISDIPYKNDRMQFTYNTKSNDITRFRLNWTYVAKIEYQGVIVPLTQAQNIYFHSAGFDLTYVQLKNQSTASYVNIPNLSRSIRSNRLVLTMYRLSVEKCWTTTANPSKRRFLMVSIMTYPATLMKEPFD